MRKVLIVGMAWLAIAGVAMAQQQHQRQSDAPQGSHHRGQGDETPPPQPIPTCSDLALAGYGYLNEVPGEAALSADEIALQWTVHNAGTATYTATSLNAQSLSLEYSTPGGAHQVATMAVPSASTAAPSAASAVPGNSAATPAIATTPAIGPITLAQGQDWRGVMRVTLTPDARRWPLRLRLVYAANNSPYAHLSDCDLNNNEIPLARAPTPRPATASN